MYAGLDMGMNFPDFHESHYTDDEDYNSGGTVFIDKPNEPIRYEKRYNLNKAESKNLVKNRVGVVFTTSSEAKQQKEDESLKTDTYDDVDGCLEAPYKSHIGKDIYCSNSAQEQPTRIQNGSLQMGKYTNIPDKSEKMCSPSHSSVYSNTNDSMNTGSDKVIQELNLLEESTETISVSSQSVLRDKHKLESEHLGECNGSKRDRNESFMDSFNPSFQIDLQNSSVTDRPRHDSNTHHSMSEYENYPTSLRCCSYSFLNNSTASGESGLKTEEKEEEVPTLTPDYCCGYLANINKLPTSNNEITSISCKTGSKMPVIAEAGYKCFEGDTKNLSNNQQNKPQQIVLQERVVTSGISVAAPPNNYEPYNYGQNAFSHSSQSSRGIPEPEIAKAASSTVAKLPSVSRHNTYQKVYGGDANYFRNALPYSHQTKKMPEVINIGEMISISEYVEKEWKGTTEKAETIRNGYCNIPFLLNLKNIRPIRGDNYCALRSTVYQILANGIAAEEHLGKLQDSLQKIDKFQSKNYRYLQKWNFADRINYDKQNVYKTVKECVECLHQQLKACRSKDYEDSRQEYLIRVLNMNPEIDLQLLEAVKCLMMINAIKFYEENINGADVPVFVWLLFARDTSDTPEKFLINHMNKIGDTSGMEQIEMILLGYTLGVKINVVRPYLFEKEDFITHFPNDCEEKFPQVNLIAEDDRHYNVLVS